MSLESRFWSKVEKSSACWLWMANRVGNGYGQISVNGRKVYAHRLSYEWAKGPIPAGLDIDHLCRVLLCVNPDHLEAVTRRENLLRGNTLAARQVARTHCPSSHPYDEENTRIRRGKRECRECGRVRCLARYHDRRRELHVGA